MDEVMSQELRSQQLNIAKNMGVKNEILEFLAKIGDWKLREWLYICALDNQPLENLVRMIQEKRSIEQIRKSRIDYWRRIGTDTEPLTRNLTELKREVKEALAESNNTRTLIEKNMELALERQAEAQKETIKAKDQLLLSYEKKIKEMEEKMREAEVVPQKKRQVEESKVQMEPEANMPIETHIKHARGSWFERVRQQKEVRKFINVYMKDGKMDESQKDFLLNCLEEGMPVKEIEKFASPTLDVETMGRLKRLQSLK